MAKSGLRVVSRDRQDQLTNDGTVLLGRRICGLLGVEHLSYPDGTPTVVVEIWGFSASLPREAQSAIEAVIGTFDASVVED